MKKKLFLWIFIAAHLGGIVLSLHQHICFVGQEYIFQRAEKKRTELLLKKDELLCVLHSFSDAIVYDVACRLLCLKSCHFKREIDYAGSI